jgi:hypothetical protein
MLATLSSEAVTKKASAMREKILCNVDFTFCRRPMPSTSIFRVLSSFFDERSDGGDGGGGQKLPLSGQL